MLLSRKSSQVSRVLVYSPGSPATLTVRDKLVMNRKPKGRFVTDEKSRFTNRILFFASQRE